MNPKIYADFNAFAGGGNECGVILDGFGTLKDLSFYKIRLREGMRLTIWEASDEVEDLEAGAELYYLAEKKKWVAVFPRGTLHYIPARDRTEHPFLCYSCRADVTARFRGILRDRPMICPHCGSSLMLPFLLEEKSESQPAES